MEKQNYNYEADYILFNSKELEIIKIVNNIGLPVLLSSKRDYDFIYQGKKGDVKIQEFLNKNKIVIETHLVFLNEGWRAKKWGVINKVDGWLFSYDYILVSNQNLTRFVLFDLERFRNDGKHLLHSTKINKEITKSMKGWQLVGEYIVIDLEDYKDYIVWQVKLM